MANKKQRMQNANNFRRLQREGAFPATARPCPNCKQPLYVEGHFVPPSFGEEGFFICSPPTASARGEA